MISISFILTVYLSVVWVQAWKLSDRTPCIDDKLTSISLVHVSVCSTFEPSQNSASFSTASSDTDGLAGKKFSNNWKIWISKLEFELN